MVTVAWERKGRGRDTSYHAQLVAEVGIRNTVASGGTWVGEAFVGFPAGAFGAFVALAVFQGIARSLGRPALVAVVLMLLPQVVVAALGIAVGGEARGSGLGLFLAHVVGLLGGALVASTALLRRR